MNPELERLVQALDFKVIQRNVYKPLETCGGLLDSYEHDPPPQKANPDRLSRIECERGRRSGGRK